MNCIENPFPSNEVLIKVEQGKVNYKEMKTSTEQVITTLQESKEKFDNPPFFGNQRELFLDLDLEGAEEGSSTLPKTGGSMPKEEQDEETAPSGPLPALTM